MFGRSVKIDGKEYFVMCSPSTPFSEVLRRASEQAAAEEVAERDADPQRREYRRLLGLRS